MTGLRRSMARAGVLTTLGWAVACAPRSAAAPKPSPPPQVATTVAREGVVRPALQIAGVVTPYRQIGVSSALSEPLTEVDVREGDVVHAGQVLARLETDDMQAQLASAERVVAENRARLSQTAYSTGAVSAQNATDVRAARAVLAQAEINLSGAQADYRRDLGLARDGYIPQQTLDQQRTTVVSDEQAVAAANASVQAAQANVAANGDGTNGGAQRSQIAAAQAAVDAATAGAAQLQRQMARATIVAPTDGVVAAVNANPGEYPSGRQLFTITEMSRVYAVLPASTAEAVRIRRGAQATVRAGGANGAPLHGTVEAVLDQLQPGTTNFSIKVVVPNAGSVLHAGMPVTGIVDLPAARGVVIPVSSYTDDDRSSVYVVSNGVVRKLAVRERANDGTRAAVSGLPSGANVVTDAATTSVSAGDEVRI